MGNSWLRETGSNREDMMIHDVGQGLVYIDVHDSMVVVICGCLFGHWLPPADCFNLAWGVIFQMPGPTLKPGSWQAVIVSRTEPFFNCMNHYD